MAIRRRRSRRAAHVVRAALRLPLPFLAVLAAAAVGLFLAASIFQLKDLIMKNRIVAAGALLAVGLALSGCAGSPFIRVNPDLSPDIQARQAETAQGFYKALGERLQYCTILGNIDLTLKASPDAGISNTAGLNCPARPWDQAPAAVPLSEVERLIDQKLDAYTAPK